MTDINTYYEMNDYENKQQIRDYDEERTKKNIENTLVISKEESCSRVSFNPDDEGWDLFCFYAKDIYAHDKEYIRVELDYLDGLLRNPDCEWQLDRIARRDVYRLYLEET